MELFHGTDIASALKINVTPLNVDVTLGGGELGRGFYLGENVCLAGVWARQRYKGSASVLEFTIKSADLVALDTYIMKRRYLVKEKWKFLKSKGLASKHLFEYDLVIAPFAIMDLSHQYKFESSKAELCINNSFARQIL